jgi:cytochrome c553
MDYEWLQRNAYGTGREKVMKSTVRQLAVALCAAAATMAGVASCTTTSTGEGRVSDASVRGKAVYEQHCVGCHGQLGTGDAFKSIPALAGQRLEYLRRQIEQFATDQRHDSEMQWAFKRVSMTAPESAVDVATYLSGLPMQRFADTDPRHRAQGERIYQDHCSVCHGTDGQGNADGAIPSLRDQHDTYLVNRLKRFAATSPGVAVAAHAMDDTGIVAVSAYLSSLSGLDLKSAPP